MLLLAFIALATACTSFCEKPDTEYFSTHWDGGLGAPLFYYAIPFNNSCQEVAEDIRWEYMVGDMTIMQIINGTCDIRGNFVAANAQWIRQLEGLCCHNVAIEVATVLGPVYEIARAALHECCPAPLNNSDLVAIIVMSIIGAFMLMAAIACIAIHRARFIRV